ncbi:DUF1273 domain-containing protein [Agrilactobacillus yilanensis]|uniref:UPF0398 protein ACFQ5M_08955 n=1 Tax=Agrilactobacillus yilanensis TaxID=2485997 RepID=A0ABW4J8E7_9LACO|nr:DUF1273 domain-containing protein [Agrilactobacillus yilanensis]
MKNLWLTGYRSYELNIFDDQDPKLKIIKYALKSQLLAALDQGLDWVITGGQLGVEQWGIQVVKALKTTYPELRVAAMLPFQDFGSQWNEKNQSQLAQIVSLADFSKTVSPQPYKNPQQLKQYQQFMLAHTDGALLVYDPEQPGKPKFDYEVIKRHQENQDYDLTLIDMYTLEDISQDWQENLL